MIGHYIQRLHQGIAPQQSMANGGGGGSSGVYYANMDNLYGAQARAANFMLDQAMPVLPGTLNNSQTMVNEAMDGTLGNKMRDQAGKDAAAANGASWNATNRNMSRMGANFSTDRMLSEMNKNSVMGATNSVNALNNATSAAEDMKWNRNAGLYSQASGTGSGAMSGLSSAGAGYGSMANSMSANSAANAQGYGMMGAAMGSQMMKADGGYIKAPKLASGGDAWQAYKSANPLVTGQYKSKGTNPLIAIGAGTAPYLLGAGLKAAGKDLVKGRDSETYKTVKNLFAPSDTSAQGNAVIDASRDVAPDTFAQSYGMESYGDAANTISNAAPVEEFAEEAGTSAALQQMQEEIARQAAEAAAADSLGNAAGLMLAKGGCVKKPVLRLALGGGVKNPIASNSVSDVDASSQMKVSAHPVAAPMPNVVKQGAVAQQTPSSNTPTSAAGDAVRGGKQAYASMEAAEKAQQAKEVADTAQTASKVAETAESASTAADTAKVATDAAEVADAASTAGDAATAAEGAAGAAETAVPYGSIIKAGADILSGRDTGTAVADAAAGYAGAEAGAAVGTAILPGVGTVIGGALGALAGGSLFADGGDVEPTERVDYRPGGKVAGPGTETSDDIPAWLSDGEYVLNAEAVKLVGKDKLEQINNAGLAKREGKEAVQLAVGGSLDNASMTGRKSGVVKNEGHDTWNKMDDAISRGPGADVNYTLGLEGNNNGEMNDTQKAASFTGDPAMTYIAGKMFNCGGVVKKPVKLAGGGFLGGNLGIAMGAGVQQWNKQQQLDMQQEQLDLQKQTAARQKELADMHIAEAKQKRTDQEALKTAMTKAEDSIGSANALQDRLGQLTPEESKAAYDAYKQAGMTPIDLARQGASEVRKVDLVKGMALQDAAEKDIYSKQFNALVDNKDATLDERINAWGRLNPNEATKTLANIKMQGDKSETQQLIKQMEAENRIKMAELRAEMRGGGHGSGNGSGSGSSRSGAGDGIKESDLIKLFDQSIPDDGFSVLDKSGKVLAALPKGTMFSQSVARLPELKKNNPGVSELSLINDSIEATKFHNGIPPKGKVNFQSDGKGNFVPVMTTMESTGTRSVVIGSPIPFSQIGSLDKDQLKATGTVLPDQAQLEKAEMAWNVQSLKEAKAAQQKFAQMTPQEIAQLAPDVRKRLQNLDAEVPRLEALVSAYADPSSREARGKASPASPARAASAKGNFGAYDSRVNPNAWFHGDYPTDVKNSEGTPNVLANGVNSIRNWAAQKARNASVSSSPEWGTQRDWTK